MKEKYWLATLVENGRTKVETLEHMEGENRIVGRRSKDLTCVGDSLNRQTLDRGRQSDLEQLELQRCLRRRMRIDGEELHDY
uniref:Uncharacterized protein n=1 Tax=Cucumis melo TaxID=3656 RepID=A0A9I9CUV4_CUCME